MSDEVIHPLDDDMLDYFARKGKEGGPSVQQAGNENGLKVRRIMQVISDLSGKPFHDLSILDCACGEGVYAIEAGLRGAQISALDARSQRMDFGRQFALRLGLDNVTFDLADVRDVSVSTHGQFDAILFLGILYHLDVPDAFEVLQNLAAMCKKLLIIDAHIATAGIENTTFNGRTYRGHKIREHDDDASDAERQSKVLQSIDNTFSWYFEPDSLVELLVDLGFTTVLECKAPLEPFKADNRVTLIAMKATPVAVSTYPWVNGMTPDEVEACLASAHQHGSEPAEDPGPVGPKQLVKSVVQSAFNAIGLEIRRRQ